MDKADITEDRIVTSMVGRSLENRYPTRTPKIGETIFEVKNWSVYHPIHPERQVIKNVDLSRPQGRGRRHRRADGRRPHGIRHERLRPRLGHQHHRRGLPARQARPTRRASARRSPHGLAYATEDRKTYGLNLIDHIKHNVTIANLPGVSKSGVIDDMSELNVANEYRRKTNIRSSSVYQVTGNLSGGNQQKVVLSKWLFANPDVLILDEPTRGIDVGAKYEIYTIINKLADEGKAILVISSEMPELLGICDRIYVMNEGRIVGEMAAAEASQEKIMRAIVRGEERVAS